MQIHANVCVGTSKSDLLGSIWIWDDFSICTWPILHLILILSLSLSCHTIRKDGFVVTQNSGKMTLICSKLYIFMSAAATAVAADGPFTQDSPNPQEQETSLSWD